jgi:hypothetical protein
MNASTGCDRSSTTPTPSCRHRRRISSPPILFVRSKLYGTFMPMSTPAQRELGLAACAASSGERANHTAPGRPISASFPTSRRVYRIPASLTPATASSRRASSTPE